MVVNNKTTVIINKKLNTKISIYCMLTNQKKENFINDCLSKKIDSVYKTIETIKL